MEYRFFISGELESHRPVVITTGNVFGTLGRVLVLFVIISHVKPMS